MSRPIIAVDFDGTCVDHRFPEIGPDLPGAVETLRDLSTRNNLVLWTVRSGYPLTEASRWFDERSIPLHGVNKNPDQDWGGPKVHAQLFIDDRALGAPLIRLPWMNTDGIDWSEVRRLIAGKF